MLKQVYTIHQEELFKIKLTSLIGRKRISFLSGIFLAREKADTSKEVLGFINLLIRNN